MDPSLGFAVLFLYFTALLIVSLPSGVLKNHRIILQAIQNQNDGENPAMDKNPIGGGGGGGVVMLLVSLCWVPSDELASHPGGVVMLLVSSLCWVPCDGLATHPGVVVMLLVASYWVPCDG